MIHAGFKEFKGYRIFENAVKLDPNFSECYKNLGIVFEIDQPHSIKCFEKVFETNNKDVYSLNSID